MRWLPLVLLLSGCGFFSQGSELNPVGTSHMTVVSTADGAYTFEFHDGKDRAGGLLKVTLPDGTVIDSESASVSASQPMFTQQDIVSLLSEILLIRGGQQAPPPPEPAPVPLRRPER